MKNRHSILRLSPTLLLIAQLGWAQGGPGSSSDFKLESADQPSSNRFGLAYRMGFNMPVSFKNLGGYAPLPNPANPRLTPDGDPYNYDDGYVYNDINNGAFGYTWYWGYDAAPGQYTLGASSVIMHRASSQADVTSKNPEDDLLHGFEVTYNRELHRGEHLRWGLEAAFGYTPICVDDSRTLSGDVSVTSDAYSIPIDPATGYGVTYFPVQTPGPWQNNRTGTLHGGEGGGNPLIGNTPSPLAAQFLAGGATIVGSRQFDANFYGFRLGPYLEFPAHPRVNLALSAGLALAYIESDFSYNETVSITGVAGTQTHAAAGSQSDWRVGGYVSGTVAYSFAQNWAAFAGAQYLNLGQYTHTVDDKQAALDLRSSIFVTLGLSYSF
jgi:hypothetical protein